MNVVTRHPRPPRRSKRQCGNGCSKKEEEMKSYALSKAKARREAEKQRQEIIRQAAAKPKPSEAK